MATYTPVSNKIPLDQRAALITAVAAGDRINVVDVLGRPARGVKFVTTDSADEVQYKLNNRIERINRHTKENQIYNEAAHAFGIAGAPNVIWSGASSTFTDTGEVIETVTGLDVNSIEIVSLTLSTGSTISIVVW